MGPATPGDPLPRTDLDGVLRAWTAHVGHRHELPSALPATAGGVAEARDLDPAGVDAWLDSAHALSLLARTPDRDEDRYQVTPRGAAWWRDDAPARAARGRAQRATANLVPMHRVDRTLQPGAPRVPPPHPPEEGWDPRGDARVHHGSLHELPQMDPTVGNLLGDDPHILDVGSGDGSWLLQAAREHPRARFTAHEPDAAHRDRLRTRLEDARLTDRVTVRSERAESLTYTGAFDLVHLGQVLHQVPSIVTVLGRCHHALARHGTLVASGFLLDDAAEPDAPGNRFNRSRRFLRRARGEATPSKQVLWRLLVEAGFQRIRFHPLGPPGAGFAVAEV